MGGGSWESPAVTHAVPPLEPKPEEVCVEASTTHSSASVVPALDEVKKPEPVARSGAWDPRHDILQGFPDHMPYRERCAAARTLIHDEITRNADLMERNVEVMASDFERNGGTPSSLAWQIRYRIALDEISTRDEHFPMSAIFGHHCLPGCKCWNRQDDNPEFARSLNQQGNTLDWQQEGKGDSTWIEVCSSPRCNPTLTRTLILQEDFFDQYVSSIWELKYWTDRAWYYYTGLTDNQSFKLDFVKFRGRVDKRLKWVNSLVDAAQAHWRRKDHPNREPNASRNLEDTAGIVCEYTDAAAGVDGDSRWGVSGNHTLLRRTKGLEPNQFGFKKEDWDRLEPGQKWIMQVHLMQMHMS
jgi:hypothetical protein